MERKSPLAALALAAACGVIPLACRDAPPGPLPEALMVVDTDVAVPGLASRLRVDAFAEDGTWYASRDFGRPQPGDWPLSFGVYSPDATSTRKVLLRLRTYTDGAVRDYLGERFAPRPTPASGPPYALTPVPPSPPGGVPRLMDSSGHDVTPASEPEPLLAIDRLVIVQLDPKSQGQVAITMRGACVGTMADIGSLTTCTDTENVRVAVPTVSPTSGAETSAPSSRVGTFGATVPCTATPRSAHNDPSGTPLYDEEVCVPGGTFVFGSEAQLGADRSDGIPERVAVVDPFRMDRYEVTVARWRQAVRDGLMEKPVPNDAVFPTDPAASIDTSTDVFCTYSDSPLGRETYPVSCLTWNQARAFCKLYGSDLPLEVQWEYAASQAGRLVKTAYPWGGPDSAFPPCSRTVIGRSIPAVGEQGLCSGVGIGPLSVDALDTPSGDVSVGLGIVDLGGNVGEFMSDNAESLGSNCWMQNSLHMPSCDEPGSTWASTRGAAWTGPDYPYGDLRSFFDTSFEDASPQLGFRCARPGAP